ncbi:hypothetical protein BGZ63DRAFT_127701 [Mariannaea sp. PMI_226]|nr:hypothetical protein BGZ63DRAFT_127701 [Mariannaea sp. PMI_226]
MSASMHTDYFPPSLFRVVSATDVLILLILVYHTDEILVLDSHHVHVDNATSGSGTLIRLSADSAEARRASPQPNFTPGHAFPPTTSSHTRRREGFLS